MKIELPFNFNWDRKYFDLFDAHKNSFCNIDCVYMPTYETGGINTRESLVKYPETEEKYRKYIRMFQDRDIAVNVLVQRNVTLETIKKYYLNYGVNDFTINDNILAKKIKEQYPDIRLRLSITAKVTPDEISREDLEPYDDIVLFFWYNRQLDVIKSLPKKHSYTVLCNTICLWNCPYCEEHWFGGKDIRFTLKCGSKKILWGDTLKFKDTAYIRPEDVVYFEDYVSVFKLEGREHASSHIFRDFDRYLSRKTVNGRPLYEFNEDDILSNYNIPTSWTVQDTS